MKKNLKTIIGLFVLTASLGSARAGQLRCEQFEVGFSPDAGAEELVIKTIDSARQDIRILSYSFTSKTVVRSLLNARKRGVQVAIAADQSNTSSRPGLSALSTLATAGASIRIVSAYKILHDKIIVADGKTVEFGSFNFSQAAAQANSENANVCWNAPDVANAYLAHWKSRWDQGKPFAPQY